MILNILLKTFCFEAFEVSGKRIFCLTKTQLQLHFYLLMISARFLNYLAYYKHFEIFYFFIKIYLVYYRDFLDGNSMVALN